MEVRRPVGCRQAAVGQVPGLRDICRDPGKGVLEESWSYFFGIRGIYSKLMPNTRLT